MAVASFVEHIYMCSWGKGFTKNAMDDTYQCLQFLRPNPTYQCLHVVRYLSRILVLSFSIMDAFRDINGATGQPVKSMKESNLWTSRTTARTCCGLSDLHVVGHHIYPCSHPSLIPSGSDPIWHRSPTHQVHKYNEPSAGPVVGPPGTSIPFGTHVGHTYIQPYCVYVQVRSTSTYVQYFRSRNLCAPFPLTNSLRSRRWASFAREDVLRRLSLRQRKTTPQSLSEISLSRDSPSLCRHKPISLYCIYPSQLL